MKEGEYRCYESGSRTFGRIQQSPKGSRKKTSCPAITPPPFNGLAISGGTFFAASQRPRHTWKFFCLPMVLQFQQFFFTIIIE